MSNCALWLDMGLGKTLITIAYALLTYQTQRKCAYLVICPPTIFTTWIDEINKWIDESIINVNICILHGSNKTKILTKLRTEQITKPTFILTSYETLENIRESIKTLPISLVALDECSKVKHIDSNRSRSTHALRRDFNDARFVLLSGTPSTTNPLGFYSLYELLGPMQSGFPSWQSFHHHFAVSKKFATLRLPNGKIKSTAYDNIENYPGAKIMNIHNRDVAFKNLEDIHRITQINAYTLKKSDVLTELPPKIYQKRTLEMTAEQRRIYNEVAEHSRTIIAGKPFSFSSNSPFCKLHQIANGYVLNTDKEATFFTSQPKLHELRQIMEELSDKKLVIWSPFLDQINQVAEFLASESIKCVTLTGDVPMPTRRELIHDFQHPDGAQALVANPSVGGLGLNLTCADVQVFMTNWFQPDVRNQAEDREHRIGQTNPVTIIDLVTAGTIEPGILRNTRAQINLENRIISMSLIFGGGETDE